MGGLHLESPVSLFYLLQKKKAEGPTEPQQPSKKHRPEDSPAPPLAAAMESCDAEGLSKAIEAQGNKVRELKAAAAEKVSLVSQNLSRS